MTMRLADQSKKPQCTYEFWDHKLHKMVHCGEPAIATLGRSDHLCKEHGEYVSGNCKVQHELPGLKGGIRMVTPGDFWAYVGARE